MSSELMIYKEELNPDFLGHRKGYRTGILLCVLLQAIRSGLSFSPTVRKMTNTLLDELLFQLQRRPVHLHRRANQTTGPSLDALEGARIVLCRASPRAKWMSTRFSLGRRDAMAGGSCATDVRSSWRRSGRLTLDKICGARSCEISDSARRRRLAVYFQTA